MAGVHNVGIIVSEQGSQPLAVDEARPLHILIVEDNPDGRESLRTILELYGYRVDVAADGVEGVRKGLELRPRVVLLDIGLPRLDGFQVAERLREAFGHRIKIIACTAYGQPEACQRAVTVGFDAMLIKPLDPEVLADWLAEIDRA
jgi:CheY-like chemotaxis protein